MSFAAECWPSLPSAMSQNPGQVQDSLKGFAHPSQKPAAYGGSNNPLNTSGLATNAFFGMLFVKKIIDLPGGDGISMTSKDKYVFILKISDFSPTSIH